MLRIILLIILRAVTVVDGHSWMSCTDWDEATQECKGRPRNAGNMIGRAFAADVGRDVQPGALNQAVCSGQKEPRTNPPSNSYAADRPMAKWEQGSTKTIRWPAKNHATVGSGPGTVQLYIGTAGGNDDFQKGTPFASFTYSNCVPNQAGVDAAPCTGDVAVPVDLPPGVYSIMWFWEFNPGQFYNTCSDIEIVAAANAPGTTTGTTTGTTAGGTTAGGTTAGGTTTGGNGNGNGNVGGGTGYTTTTTAGTGSGNNNQGGTGGNTNNNNNNNNNNQGTSQNSYNQNQNQNNGTTNGGMTGTTIIMIVILVVVMVLFIAYVVYSQKEIANVRNSFREQPPAVAQVQMTSNPGQINV